MARWMAVLLAAALVIVAELSRAQTEVGVTNNAIKLGLIASRTGPGAYFAAVADGVSLHVKRVNAAGGIEGRKIEIVEYDDQGKVDLAVTLARRLVEQDKVFAMVGHFGLASRGAANVFREHGRVYFGAVSADDLLGNPKAAGQTTFRVIPAPKHLAQASVRHMERQGMLKDDAIVLVGRAGSPPLVSARQLLRNRVRIEVAFTVPPTFETQRAFDSALRRAVEAKPRVLLVVDQSTVTQVLAVVKATQGVHSTVPIWIEPFPPVLFAAAPDALVMRSIPPLDVKTDGTERYRTEANKEGQALSDAGFMGWGIANVFFEGLRRAGRYPTTKTLIAAFEKFRAFNSALGPITYDQDNHQGNTSGHATRTKDGKTQSTQTVDACCDDCKPDCESDCLKDKCK